MPRGCLIIVNARIGGGHKSSIRGSNDIVELIYRNLQSDDRISSTILENGLSDKKKRKNKMEENCTKLECSGGHSIDELRKQSSMSKAETKPNNAPRKSVRERIEERVFRSSQPISRPMRRAIESKVALR